MRHYTKLALAGALLVAFFVIIEVIGSEGSSDGAPLALTETFSVSTLLEEAPTATVTVPETTVPETTTTTTTVPATTVPPLPKAPGCSTWASQQEADAWFAAHGSEYDTSNIDTNHDGRPCTRHFAPPPPPAPPTTVAPTTVAPTTVAPAPPPAPTGSVESIIRAAAAEFGVSGNLLVSIARCESTLNPNAVNRSSGALGLFQHLPRYWGGRAATLGYSYDDWSNPTANARVSARMIAQGGTSPWNASRHCWG